jgi:hypothetical protein
MNWEDEAIVPSPATKRGHRAKLINAAHLLVGLVLLVCFIVGGTSLVGTVGKIGVVVWIGSMLWLESEPKTRESARKAAKEMGKNILRITDKHIGSVILWLTIVILCAIILSAPRYVQIPHAGGYVRFSNPAKYKHLRPQIDWAWVAQRGLPVVLVAAGLLYTVRGRRKKP